eukprot:1147349-Pelagomonas_calceolata.AAC.5
MPQVEAGGFLSSVKPTCMALSCCTCCSSRAVRLKGWGFYKPSETHREGPLAWPSPAAPAAAELHSEARGLGPLAWRSPATPAAEVRPRNKAQGLGLPEAQ